MALVTPLVATHACRVTTIGGACACVRCASCRSQCLLLLLLLRVLVVAGRAPGGCR